MRLCLAARSNASPGEKEKSPIYGGMQHILEAVLRNLGMNVSPFFREIG
jgi:hypothetical protein